MSNSNRLKRAAAAAVSIVLAVSLCSNGVIAQTVSENISSYTPAYSPLLNNAEQNDENTNEDEISADEDTSEQEEIPQETAQPVESWWKAGLSDYDDDINLSSVMDNPDFDFEALALEAATYGYSQDTESGCYIIGENKVPSGIFTKHVLPIIETSYGLAAVDGISDLEDIQSTLAGENMLAESEGTGIVTAPVQSDKTAAYPSAPGMFCFTTYGYGHGVGLSQNGANFYATYGGYNYQQILQFYYPGTYLQNTGTGGSETFTVKGISGTALYIVSCVCYAEIGTTMNEEAIKAQAIAAYTNIKYSGGSSNGMAIKQNPPQSLINVVSSVIGQAVYYNGSLALTPFYASSGGVTSSCRDIFNEDLPYLRSITVDYDAQYDKHYGTVTEMSVDTVRYKLQAAFGIKLSNNYRNWFIVTKGDGGIAAEVNIDNQITVKGYKVMYALGLKSPNVQITCS